MEASTGTDQQAGGSTPGALPAIGEAAAPAAAAAPVRGTMDVLRDWADALLIAIVLAMFVRIFIFELFKIPTGSMIPTLIGGEVADADFDGDSRTDLLALAPGATPLLFLNRGGALTGQGPVALTPAELTRLRRQGAIHEQYDSIMVNKFAYWFHPPRRGDVVVFKVPDAIWDPDKPTYIKRCVGLPGERLGFDASGRLVADGRRVDRPSFFERQRYLSAIENRPELAPAGAIQYDPIGDGRVAIRRIDVPLGQIFVFGDNTWNSLDSRYWGGVPLDNIKGRAFFRYRPLNQMKFLNGQ